MRKKRFNVEQMIGVLKQAEVGVNPTLRELPIVPPQSAP
jgi:hypothetical protein